MTDAAPEPVPLASRRLRDRVGAVALLVGGTTGFALVFTFQISTFFVRALGQFVPLIVSIGTVILAWILVTAGIVGLYLLLHPVPVADGAAGILRVGRRRIPYSAIDSATVVAAVSRRQRTVGIRFGTASALHSIVLIRHGDRLRLDERQRDALLDVIERSGIHVPHSPYDPEGRFGRYNFPGHLGREEAARFVRDPPTPDEALPMAS